MMKHKKAVLISLLTTLVSLSTFSTDIYLPSLPKLTEFFHTSVAISQLTLSIYMLGFALSMFICGPLADKYGRKPVILGGIGLHLLSSLFCIFAPTIESLIIARFFQALGGCCGTVLGRVIARDLFDEKECVKVLSYLSAGLAISLTLAPLIGGFLQAFFDWRSGFIVLAILSGLIFVASCLLLEETLHLRRPLNFKNLALNYLKIIKNRHFLAYTSAITFAWCGYFSFISGSSYVFINLMQIPPQSYGMLYTLVIIGYIFGTLLASRLSNRWSPRESVFLGATLTLVGGLLMITLAFSPQLKALNLILPMMFYLVGTGLIMPNSQAVVTKPFPHLTGSASSLFYFIEMLFGALTGGLVGIFLKNNPLPMIIAIVTSSIFLFLSSYQMIWKSKTSVLENP